MAMTDTYSADMMNAENEDGYLLEDDAGETEQEVRPEEVHQKLMRFSQAINIAEDLDDDLLNKIGQRVKREYEIDLESRKEWLAKNSDAMDLAMQVAKEKNYPWPKASNVIYPLMTTAAIQFAARAYPAIIADRDVVKGVVVGDDSGQIEVMQGPNGEPVPATNPDGLPAWTVEPGVKQKRADRIGDHMSYQLLDEMEDWEEDTDKLLHVLPIAGCVFRKSYHDSGTGTNVSCMVMAKNIVVNYWAKSMGRAPRVTEELKLYPLEIEEMIRSGVFLDHDFGKPPEAMDDDDAPHEFLEQHRWWDLDGDEYPEPYVVTIHKETTKVCRIVARFDPEGVKLNKKQEVTKIDPVHYYTKYDFMPNPEGGVYGVGLGQLLKPINDAVNTSLNMLIDAGHLQNAGGGFIGKGLSLHSGAVKFRPGEYKVVNSAGTAVRDAVVPLTFPGPSPVLFELLGTLVEAGKDISASNNILAGDIQSAQMQPTTMLALIEQGLKVFVAIYKRVHRSLKQEYSKLYRLNRLYLQDTAEYRVGDEWKQITREDYERGSGVQPISDPAMVSDMQKLARAQFLAAYQNDPLCDPLEIRKRIFESANLADVEKLFAQQPPGPPPELVLMQLELEAKMRRDAAASVKDMALAVKAIADADAVEGDQNVQWAQAQTARLKLLLDAVSGAQGSQGQSAEQGQGLRQAPDGNWYAPDPLRPGKYLMVDIGGAVSGG